MAELSGIQRSGLFDFCPVVWKSVAVITSDPAVDHPPIIDLRSQSGGSRRWVARALTSGAWLGTLTVAGPLAWKGALIGVGCAALLRRRLPAQRRPPHPRANPSALQRPPAGACRMVSRRELAAAFQLDEVLLFRTRHARICTVEHDLKGMILAINPLDSQQQAAVSAPNAHSVG